MIFIPIALVIIIYDIYRIKKIGKPIINYKNKLIDDRFLEIIFIAVSFIIGIMTFILMYKLGANEAIIHSLPYFISGLMVLVFMIIEYNKNKIGIFENGTLYKSRFIKWEEIYTFRSYDLTDGNIKITLYIHERLNKENLWKQNIVVEPELGVKIEKELNKRLDRNKE